MKKTPTVIPGKAGSIARIAFTAAMMLVICNVLNAQQIITPTVNDVSSENNALYSTTTDGGGRDTRASATVSGFNTGALSGPGDASTTYIVDQAYIPGFSYMWESAGSADPNPYITYDLGGLCNLTKTRIWNYNESADSSGNPLTPPPLYVGASNILISTSLDGTNFTVLTNVNLAEAGGTFSEPAQDFSTPATAVRYVRFQILTNWNGAVFWSSITGTNIAGPNSTAVGLSQVVFEADPFGPNITAQPAAQTLQTNSTATFSVTAMASSDQKFTYQWRKNGTNLVDGGNISGSATSTLQINNISRGDQANYDVVVSNSLASVVSKVAALHVDSTLIIPLSVTPSSEFNNGTYKRLAQNLIAIDPSAGFGVGMTGPGYFTDTHDDNEDGQIADAWHHTPGDNSPFVTFDLGGYYDVYNTRIWNLNQNTTPWNSARTIRISGSTDGSTFTVIGTNVLDETKADFAALYQEPAQDFSTPASNVRYIKIDVLDGYGGGWNGLSAVRFEGSIVSALVPAITNQPVGWTNGVGQTASFTVGATDGGAPPLTYQWKKNGTNLVNGGNITGANSVTLTIANVAISDMGNYSVVVSNAVTSTPSAQVFLQPVYALLSVSSATGGTLITPSISDFSSYFNVGPYVRNVTNLVQNNFVTDTTQVGLSGLGYATDTHDNGQDDVWHIAQGDTNRFVTLDLGATYNLLITRIWNLNQGNTDPNSTDNNNGAQNLFISVSADGVTFTVLGTNTLAEAPGYTNSAPAQDISTPASSIRYVKLTLINNYGGIYGPGLSAVRFVVAGPQSPRLVYANLQGVTGLHYQLLSSPDLTSTNWQVVSEMRKLSQPSINVPIYDGLVGTNTPQGFYRAVSLLNQ